MRRPPSRYLPAFSITGATLSKPRRYYVPSETVLDTSSQSPQDDLAAHWRRFTEIRSGGVK
jgi:hypothetical protein